VEKGDELFFRVIGLEAPVFSLKKTTPCSLGLSTTNQQYFSLRTNQPPATSEQYFSLGTNLYQPSAISKTNRLQTEVTAHVFITAIS
jgi:hypothetical protein